MFTKLATKVDSQEMWLPIVFGGDEKRFRSPHTPKPFLGRSSSLSQWRAFQRISWQPMKLSSQNVTMQTIKEI